MSAPALQYLADESCDFAVVRALRAEDHDVLAISEVMHRSDDRGLIEQAHREQRIPLAEDRDFPSRDGFRQRTGVPPAPGA